MPVRPPKPFCCPDCLSTSGGLDEICGVCSPVGDLEDDDFATDGGADLEDVVIGYEQSDGKDEPVIRELPAPKGMSVAEWKRHCISHIPYCGRCPFRLAGKKPN